MDTKDNMDHKYEALFNNGAIGIITVDQHAKIISVNKFALAQFGYESEVEVLGKEIELLIPTRYKERHRKHIDEYQDSEQHSRPMGSGMDLFAIRKNGQEFPVEVCLSPYKGVNGNFVIAFISDISIRKESENALKELNAALEQKVEERTHSLQEALEKEKDLNELKSRFVSMASHEFRTPLSTILSSSFLSSKYTSEEDQAKRLKHHDRIVSSVNMLTDTLNDFLLIGKIEEGKMVARFCDIDIRETITSLISEMKTILKKGQHIQYTHAGDTAVVLDPSMLKHIVMNLVSNAIKFSPEGSELNIQTKNINGELILSVKDSGLGISKDDQQHLFERFFRGANVTNIQGTGLGLHIVARYAELMYGNITCESELEKGTQFTIVFKLNHHENDIADRR